jgi:hypothetical protein
MQAIMLMDALNKLGGCHCQEEGRPIREMNWQHVHKEILEDAAHGPVIAHVNGSKTSAVMAASARQLCLDSRSSSFIL